MMQGCKSQQNTTTQMEGKMEYRFLLDAVMRKCAAVLEPLASKDETLLARRNALRILDLCLHVVDRVRGLKLEHDDFAGKGLHKNLHATVEMKDKTKGGLFVDVIIKGCVVVVLELFASEDETLLVGGNSLFILDLGSHVIDGVRRFDLKSDRFAGKSF